MKQIIHNIYCTDKSVVVLSLLVLSVFCCVYKFLCQRKPFNKKVVLTALAFAVFATLCPTVFQRLGGAHSRDLLLMPLRSISMYLDTEYEEWLRLCLMNIALFYPLGCAYACFEEHKNIKPWMFVVLSLLLSVVIELAQFVFSLGCTETDDVINNTLGALFGYLITTLFYKTLKRILKE